MLQAYDDINTVLNKFLNKYTITRAFLPTTVKFENTIGMTKAEVKHNEDKLKLYVEFIISKNQLCNCIPHYVLIDGLDKSQEFKDFFYNLSDNKKGN